MIFVPLPACCLRLLDLIKSSNTTCCYTGSMVRFYVQEVQRDTSLHVPSSQGSNGQNETPFKGTQHQHSAATARSSRGHDHTRVPSILLAFWNWCSSRSVCFFWGGEKAASKSNKPIPERSRWTWTLSVFCLQWLKWGLRNTKVV